MLLYIVRHGEPDYTTDTLTQQGRREAEAVSRRMVKSGINRVFSSPMGRARQTAQPTCDKLGLAYTVLDWAHEIEDGRLTDFPLGKRQSVTYVPSFYYRTPENINLDYDHAFEADGFRQSGMKPACKRIIDGGREFLEKLGYREENGIYRILRPNEERIALFCHGAMGRAWISHLLHIPIHIMWASFDYSFTGVTVLEFPHYEEGFTAPRCLSYCDLSHLYEDGQDVRYNKRFSV